MSKSRGTAIWIEEYLKTFFDPDPLRYYLTAVAPETQRTAFDIDDFIARNNGELLNALGNFINRTLTFIERYFDGRVPEAGRAHADVDLAHLELIAEKVERVTAELEAFRFKAALSEVMALARASNGYLDVKQPWKQRKTDLEGCGTTLNVCVQTVKALATLDGAVPSVFGRQVPGDARPRGSGPALVRSDSRTPRRTRARAAADFVQKARRGRAVRRGRLSGISASDPPLAS